VAKSGDGTSSLTLRLLGAHQFIDGVPYVPSHTNLASGLVMTLTCAQQSYIRIDRDAVAVLYVIDRVACRELDSAASPVSSDLQRGYISDSAVA